MNIKNFKENGKAVGTMLKVVRNPAVAAIAKQVGLDFIMLDMEHGDYGFQTLSDTALVANSLELGVMVRVPELTKGYVSRALDCGAKGVMVPMVETQKQAELLVKWSKYAPLGNRGISGFGAHTGFSRAKDIKTFMENENFGTLCIAQIETLTAVENIDQIAGVEGIDALLIGPHDLAGSLGCPGNLESDKMGQAIAKVAEAAREKGKIFGIHGSIPMIEKWMDAGLRLIMSSVDLDFLFDGMEKVASLIGRGRG